MLTSASAARACPDIAPFEIEYIRQADAVFTGQLVAYERVSPGEPGLLYDYGLLTFRVDEVIKGAVPKRVQLHWWNASFGVPETLTIETPLLIGAVSDAADGRPLPEGSATIDPTDETYPMQLLQAPCSVAFLLDNTEQSTENVRKILRGESVPWHDYFALQQAEAARQDVEVEETKAATTPHLKGGAATVAVFATIALTAWFATRRKS
jgi:hypothetical protein